MLLYTSGWTLPWTPAIVAGWVVPPVWGHRLSGGNSRRDGTGSRQQRGGRVERPSIYNAGEAQVD